MLFASKRTMERAPFWDVSIAPLAGVEVIQFSIYSTHLISEATGSFSKIETTFDNLRTRKNCRRKIIFNGHIVTYDATDQIKVKMFDISAG